ncbi:radical SAM/SPASM domain-containing protein [Thomasclavelia cocleata]|uniref:radical SAM/SPASM domain-containing protein n=1 Tax=Thomasclavelia cocleata TaxID=69824 RepID=UPI00272DD253|nr:radical SAM protein [Thomasclavelia cocleata]
MKVNYSNRIYYEITSNCNLKCIHCSDMLHGHNNQLNISDVLTFHQKVMKLGIKDSVVTGGEPTLNKDFYDIVNNLANFGNVLITSNAIDVDYEKIKQLLKNKNVIYQISCDGISKDIFESIRGRNTYNRVFNIINCLVEDGYQNQLALSMTIMKDNYVDVKKMISFVKQKKIKYLHFPTLLPTGVAKKDWEKIALSPKEQIRIDNIILNEMQNENNLIITSNRIEYILTKINTKGCQDCLSNPTLKVTADGTIFACPASVNRKYSLGNIHDDLTIENLEKKLKSIKQKVKFIRNKCIKCKYLLICTGKFCSNCVLLEKPEEMYFNHDCKIIKSHFDEAFYELGEN